MVNKLCEINRLSNIDVTGANHRQTWNGRGSIRLGGLRRPEISRRPLCAPSKASPACLGVFCPYYTWMPSSRHLAAQSRLPGRLEPSEIGRHELDHGERHRFGDYACSRYWRRSCCTRRACVLRTQNRRGIEDLYIWEPACHRRDNLVDPARAGDGRRATSHSHCRFGGTHAPAH